MKFMFEWRGRAVDYKPFGVYVMQGRDVWYGNTGTDNITKMQLVPEDWMEEKARLGNPYIEAFGPILETNNYKSPDKLIKKGLQFIRAEWGEDGFKKPIPDLV